MAKKSTSSSAYRRRQVYELALQQFIAYKGIPRSDLTYLELAIDSEYFFRFDKRWTEDVRGLRQHFLGQAKPFKNIAQAERELSGRSPRLTDQYMSSLGSLMLHYGLNDLHQVDRHVVLGENVVYWPSAKGEFKTDEYGIPYMGLRLYSSTVLRRFKRLHPRLFTAYSASDYQMLHDTLLDSVPGKIIQKGMSWQGRVRTWVIHLNTVVGGGTQKVELAVADWNDWAADQKYGQWHVEPHQYYRQMEKLLAKIESHLARARLRAPR